MCIDEFGLSTTDKRVLKKYETHYEPRMRYQSIVYFRSDIFSHCWSLLARLHVINKILGRLLKDLSCGKELCSSSPLPYRVLQNFTHKQLLESRSFELTIHIHSRITNEIREKFRKHIIIFSQWPSHASEPQQSTVLNQFLLVLSDKGQQPAQYTVRYLLSKNTQKIFVGLCWYFLRVTFESMRF